MFEVFCYTAAIVFILWIRATPEPTVATAAPEPEEESTPAATVAATIATPVAVLQVATPAPVEEPTATATAWATLTSQELRRACQDRGIRWRNAHGAGLHLKKPEMVAALT